MLQTFVAGTGLTTLLLWVATLAGVLLIAAGIAGSHPRPSDGKWQALSPSVRAGLTVVGLMAILGGWAMNQGWFKTPLGARTAPPPRYSDARGDQPVDSLWNEAEVAERQARQHPQPSPSPSPTGGLPAIPQAEPGTAAPPALEPVAAPVTAAPETAAAPAAVPAPAPPAQAVPAPAATTPAPTQVAAAAPPPVCNCDQPAASKSKPAVSGLAARPRSPSRSSYAGRGDVVSVCALQQQYGIAPASSTSYRGTSASLRVQDRLGADQQREQLRISIDGGAAATLDLGPSKRSGSVSLRAPRDGAGYRLSGYTEYRDGRRVPLSGTGFLDGGATRYELRLADEYSGSVFLEPAS